MEKTLDVRQLNNLLTGKELAAEVTLENSEYRAFVVTGAYVLDDEGKRAAISTYLNPQDDGAQFWIRFYEIEEAYLSSWDADLHLHNEYYQDGIMGITLLEAKLLMYLPDLAALDISWRIGNPL